MSDLVPKTPAPLTTGVPPQHEVGGTLLISWLAPLSDSTKVSYMRDLGHFAKWGGFPGDVPQALNRFFAFPATVRNYKAAEYKSMLVKHYSPRTCNRRLASLRSLARKAVELGLLDAPLAVRGVRQPEKADHADIEPEHYWKLLDHLEAQRAAATPGSQKEFRVIRDLAIIRLLHDRALRRKEVGTLALSDVDTQRERVIIHPKGPKGSRVARDLAGEVWEALVDWLEVRGDCAGPLFGITDLSSINKIVARRARAAGLPQHVHPHLFRRAAASEAVKAGGVQRAQALTGHKSTDMLLYYARRSQQKTADLVDTIGRRPKKEEG